MFASALSAVSAERSTFGFKPKPKVLVLLVDGMGAENVLARAGHAPWLARELRDGATSLASFPATTSTNIAGFATGLMPGEHGFIGHMVSDKHFGLNLNLLNGWNTQTEVPLWQPHQTVSERAASRGIACNVIAAEEYRLTGFTQATMREARFFGVDDLALRFEKALELISSSEESINYLYVPELDKFGHNHGWQSPGWAIQLEVIAALIDQLVKRCPKDAGLVITADHGMIDTAESEKIELDEALRPLGIKFFGGDTRTALIYLEDNQEAARVQRELAGNRFFSTHTPAELRDWYGEFGEQALNRLPELVLIARGNHTLYHSDFSKPKSYRMISHHGAMSSAELRIPLVRVGI